MIKGKYIILFHVVWLNAHNLGEIAIFSDKNEKLIKKFASELCRLISKEINNRTS